MALKRTLSKPVETEEETQLAEEDYSSTLRCYCICIDDRSSAQPEPPMTVAKQR